jgi:hypothetical protein
MPGFVLLAGLACGCGGGDASQPPKTAVDSAKQAIGGLVGGLMQMAQKQESLDRTNPYKELRDPCVLVSRAEAEKYLGPLAGDPYRAGGTQPSADGTTCLYRGANGQTIILDPNNFNGGRMGMKMLGTMGGLVNTALVTESGSADTLEGDWDDVRWTFGQLNALKGDVLINLDVSGSTAGVVGAADLANIAIHRLDHPLAYDGAKAASHAPGPLVTPKDPCSLVTREEAAAILGPLSGEPTHVRDACTYTVAGAGGTRPVELQVSWTGGFKAMNDAKMTTRMVDKSFTEPITASTEKGQAEMQKDTEAQKFMGQVQGVMRAMGGPAMENGSLRLKTDTAGLKGPWDQAAILNGFTFMAVKKDVLMSVGLQYLDEKKAEALVSKAMSRL